MTPTLQLWLLFNAFIALMLALDLGVFHRKARVVKFREALGWSIFWVALALAFGALYHQLRGPEAAVEFVTGYLVELSLSADNLFVFLLMFSYFKVRPSYQHTVLFWGIVGAAVMRLFFILAGVALLTRFHWLVYAFGGLLVFSGIKLWGTEEPQVEPERNPVVRLFRRFVPVTERYYRGHFFVRRAGMWLATPLAVVLLVVETTDLVFALDSIPAVLAITRDPFTAYSSNAFAILGLRSMYFAVVGFMQLFHRLHYGLSAILVLIGAKMVLSDVVHVPTPYSLAAVALIIAISIAASLIWPEAKEKPSASA